MILVYETTFDAAHSLPGYKGKCARVHGHTYKLQVHVKGRIDAKTSMVMDFSDLRRVCNEALQSYDHRNLNDVINYPTVEVVLMFLQELIQAELRRHDKSLSLVELRLWETPNCSAIWRKPDE